MGKVTVRFLTEEELLSRRRSTPVHLDLQRISRHLKSASQENANGQPEESPGASTVVVSKK
jgi:hypothetical protein